jgi:hypothetical protein
MWEHLVLGGWADMKESREQPRREQIWLHKSTKKGIEAIQVDPAAIRAMVERGRLTVAN